MTQECDRDTATSQARPKAALNDPIIWVMMGLLVVCNVGVMWIFWQIWSRFEVNDLVGQTFAVRLMQLTLGMIIGLSTTFLGVMLAWYGVREAVELDFARADVRGKMAAAGPGALLALCGTVLIWTCIHKEIRVEDRGTGLDLKTVPS